MSDPAPSRLTVEQFYKWLATVDGRWEFVDGQPVMMAGATNRHDRIVRNALIYVGTHLRGHPCQPFTADIYIVIPAGNRRQGDLGIDCGTPDDNSIEAQRPTFVMEILSPTTRGFDMNEKIEEYKSVKTLEYILLVDPEFPQVRLYRRQSDLLWTSDRFIGLEASLDLPRFSMGLPLASLYEGLRFTPRPTLLLPENQSSKFDI